MLFGRLTPDLLNLAVQCNNFGLLRPWNKVLQNIHQKFSNDPRHRQKTKKTENVMTKKLNSDYDVTFNKVTEVKRDRTKIQRNKAIQTPCRIWGRRLDPSEARRLPLRRQRWSDHECLTDTDTDSDSWLTTFTSSTSLEPSWIPLTTHCCKQCNIRSDITMRQRPWQRPWKWPWQRPWARLLSSEQEWHWCSKDRQWLSEILLITGNTQSNQLWCRVSH